MISPFVDKRHGTERCLAELIERLVRDYACDIHLYAQRVQDLTLEPATEVHDPTKPGIHWHKVPSIPGPHLVQYVWWFAANTVLRWWHARSGRFSPDLLFSPGINAFDAEVIHVHIVFAEFIQRMGDQLRFGRTSVFSWPVLLHRRLYYGLIRCLEAWVYPKNTVQLAGVSEMVRDQLQRYFKRSDTRCIRNGVNIGQFAPAIRLRRRPQAREDLSIPANAFIFLLIGNDWRKKGLETAIEAFGKCRELPIELLVVGCDQRQLFSARIDDLCLSDKIRFLPPSEDVMKFYAAADAYLGPSLEDAFGVPVLEAMACGLPVVASITSGVSEIIEDHSTGLLLHDPRSGSELATLIRKVFSDSALRRALIDNAPRTAERYTWDQSAAALWELLNQSLAGKHSAKQVTAISSSESP